MGVLVQKHHGFGFILSTLVALVILGGIKRIGTATEFIVPFMCGLYVLVSLYIIFFQWQSYCSSFKIDFHYGVH